MPAEGGDAAGKRGVVARQERDLDARPHHERDRRRQGRDHLGGRKRRQEPRRRAWPRGVRAGASGHGGGKPSGAGHGHSHHAGSRRPAVSPSALPLGGAVPADPEAVAPLAVGLPFALALPDFALPAPGRRRLAGGLAGLGARGGRLTRGWRLLDPASAPACRRLALRLALARARPFGSCRALRVRLAVALRRRAPDDACGAVWTTPRSFVALPRTGGRAVRTGARRCGGCCRGLRGLPSTTCSTARRTGCAALEGDDGGRRHEGDLGPSGQLRRRRRRRHAGAGPAPAPAAPSPSSSRRRPVAAEAGDERGEGVRDERPRDER